MIKVLFLIHDLGQGGAEKVLVNLVNKMNKNVFDITVMALFAGGVNEQYLEDGIRYITIFNKMIPGNSKLMKLFTPERLHKMFIKDKYDIEVSYLEGPPARIISGCNSSDTSIVSWIHVEQHSRKTASASFRSEREAEKYYRKFNQHVFVSKTVQEDFLSLFPQEVPCSVLYNTVDSDKIRELSVESIDEKIDDNQVNLIAVGTLKEVKGFDRLIRITRRLIDAGCNIHLYILGKGILEDYLKEYVCKLQLDNQVTFLGYKANPYKYVSKCDLFVCSSYREGFSTAAAEALIVGTPICTVEVSGMHEMLGENNEYGIVTDNSEDALYEGLILLIDNQELLNHYKQQAIVRGKGFNTKVTVKAVEDMLLNLNRGVNEYI